MNEHEKLQQKIINCYKCERLVKWREKVAKNKTRRYKEQEYWGKPVPSFGDINAKLWIIGLAPAAHGANRTGRMFTGDKSGDWLYDALFSFNFASQKSSVHKNDGLTLYNCYISAVVRCAPPNNKPNKEETENCFPFLIQEYKLLKNLKIILTLGQFAYNNTIKLLKVYDNFPYTKKPKFKHNQILKLKDNKYLISSYHPSQQNTFTKKLTKEMWYSVFENIVNIINK